MSRFNVGAAGAIIPRPQVSYPGGLGQRQPVYQSPAQQRPNVKPVIPYGVGTQAGATTPGQTQGTPGMNVSDQGGAVSPAILAQRRAQLVLPATTPGLPSDTNMPNTGTNQTYPRQVVSANGTVLGTQIAAPTQPSNQRIQQPPTQISVGPTGQMQQTNQPPAQQPPLPMSGFIPQGMSSQVTTAAIPGIGDQLAYQQILGQTTQRLGVASPAAQSGAGTTQVTPQATNATTNAISAAAGPGFANPASGTLPQNALSASGQSAPAQATGTPLNASNTGTGALLPWAQSNLNGNNVLTGINPQTGQPTFNQPTNGVQPGQDSELTNSLGRAQQLQSDINSLGTNTSTMTPAQQLQYQQDQAQLANEQRYEQLLQMTNSQAAGTSSALDTNLSQLEGLSGSGLASALGREQLLAQNQAGAATQNAVGRGLGNTTILDSMQRGVANDSALRTQGLYDQANSQLYNTISQYGTQQQNLLNTLFNQRANIIQNRTDSGPDMTAFAYLLSQAGANGGSNAGTNLGGSLNSAGGTTLQQLLQSLGLASGTNPTGTPATSGSPTSTNPTTTPLPTNAQGVPLINGAPYYTASTIAAMQQQQQQQAAPWGSPQNPAYLPGGLSSGGGRAVSNQSPANSAIQSLLQQLGVVSPNSSITGGTPGLGGTYQQGTGTVDYNSPGMAIALGANRTPTPPPATSPGVYGQQGATPDLTLPGNPSPDTLNNYLSGADYLGTDPNTNSYSNNGQGNPFTDALMGMSPDALVSFLTAFGG